GLRYNTESGQAREAFAYMQSSTWAAEESRILEHSAKRVGPGATFRFGCVASKFDAAFSVLSRYEHLPCALGTNGGVIDLAPLDESETARIAVEFEKFGVNFA